MRSPGEVLSKRVILDHVWDFAYDGDPNIVEVYVGQLRRRIDEPFGRAPAHRPWSRLPAGPEAADGPRRLGAGTCSGRRCRDRLVPRSPWRPGWLLVASWRRP